MTGKVANRNHSIPISLFSKGFATGLEGMLAYLSEPSSPVSAVSLSHRTPCDEFRAAHSHASKSSSTGASSARYAATAPALPALAFISHATSTAGEAM